VASELARAGLRSSPQKLWNSLLIFVSAAHSSGSKLPRYNDKGRLSAPFHKQVGLSSPSTCLALRWLVTQDPQSLTSPFRERAQYCLKLNGRQRVATCPTAPYL